MVCLDVYLFDDQEADQVAKIAVVRSSKARKYDSEKIEKMEG
jgi:hypothetical protein